LPAVSFAVPVLNAAGTLASCLQSIADQDYPQEKIEIIVADGGSTDDTIPIARSFDAVVIHNPRKLAEPGVELAFSAAHSDIVFVMAADNGLPRRDWLRLMTRPFVERPEVIGVFTQIVEAPTDNSFTKYYCRLHVEPFTWFVYGESSNPRFFDRVYRASVKEDGYVIYDYTPMTHPLVALAQGFGVRKSFRRRPGYDEDDILPIVQMIEDGQSIAYVPDAGVYHHHLESIGHFARKYRWRIRNSLYGDTAGFDSRAKYLTWWRRAKKYLFEIYGLSVIPPFLDSIALCIREKTWAMLWHGPATVVLCWIVLLEYIGKTLRKREPEE